MFFSRREATKGHFVLKAIDHGCCFTCGGELTVRLSNLDSVQDGTLYGRFPQFDGRIDRATMLRIVQEVEAVLRPDVEAMIRGVPREWDLNSGVQQALCDFICQRARYIREIINRELPRQSLFEEEPGQEPPS